MFCATRCGEEKNRVCIAASSPFLDINTFHLKHQISDHHEVATPPLMEVIEPESIEWVDPIQGASPLPPANPRDLPAGAPDIARTYAEFFNVACPARWRTLRLSPSDAT